MSGIEEKKQEESGYGQLFAIFWYRRAWFLGFFCGVLAIAIPINLNKPSVYRSSFQLLVEPNYKDERPENSFTDSSVELDYVTQMQLMASSTLLQRAVDKLKASYPDISVSEIKQSLNLNQVQENKIATKIFQAVYTADDPIKTQSILEALMKVYQEYNLEQQEQRLSDGLGFINRQIPLARESLLMAENDLKQFRIKHNLVDPVPEAAAVSDNLRMVQSNRESLKAQYNEIAALYKELESKLPRVSDEGLNENRLSQSQRYQRLLDQQQQNELAIAQQGVKFTDNFPGITELYEQQKEIETLLRQEAERVLGSIPGKLAAEDKLMEAGQLGSMDQEMVSNLNEADTKLSTLQAKDKILAATERRLKQQLKQFPELIAQYNILSQDVEVKRATLQQLLEAKQTLGIELNRGGFNWQVVEPPRLGQQIGPNLVRDMLLGGVVAVFLGGAAAFVREAVDDALRDSEQLKHAGELTLLGVIPKWQPLNRNVLSHFSWQTSSDNESLVFPLIYWQPFREALDLIYKNIQIFHRGNRLKSLMVTSALEGEGKSTLTLGLAFSASRQHHRVLVIDANFRHPSWHEKFDLPNEDGLSYLIANETAISQVHTLFLADTSVDIITAGPMPDDPVTLLGSERLGQLIREFEQSYDLVLLDTSATLGVVDALQVASYTQGVVMIGRLDLITNSDLDTATEVLRQFNLIGIVANGSKQTKFSQNLTQSSQFSIPQNVA